MVLVSRERAIQVRTLVTVAFVSRTIRGIPTEVALGPEDGLPKPCAANADTLATIAKDVLRERICGLSPAKLAALDRALRFALALD